MEQQHTFQNAMAAMVLTVAPLLFGASTFFWANGEYGVGGATLLYLSQVFWIMAFVVLFGKLKADLPRYTAIGLPLAIYGCLSGVSFGFVGFYNEAFNISHSTYIDTFARYPLASNLMLFWNGPLFPLSLLVLSILLVRCKKLPLWAGVLLCAGAVGFPVSRILRIEAIAHAVDALVALPMIWMAARELSTVQQPGQTPAQS